MSQLSSHNVTYLKDYQVFPFDVESMYLEIHMENIPQVTVIAKTKWKKKHSNSESSLVLEGEHLKLISLKLNHEILNKSDYLLSDNQLSIIKTPDCFELEIVTKIYPDKNTSLMGFYRSESVYCTQCEAQGFRKITYYSDRPDVMSIFTTKIIADKIQFPVMLANGNCIEQGIYGKKNHYVVWHDPFKKPSYLFAMVIGNLECTEDSFATCSGKNIKLRLYVESQNLRKTNHAMQALKKAMSWDEEFYDREYDLDIYMIVAVNDFNMGAMENKGLNIFNTKYVLSDSQTATDEDYELIDSVIGHEYFHNWSGNRVTCRDWFQLSLKEGFTVFREQQFSEYLIQSPTCRIQQAQLIKSRQFSEDSGPLAHSVRPESYIEINNFYTMTVYEKGAELIRMIHEILGPEDFRSGTNLYFSRHDGQAVTIDDFVQALMDASQKDLKQFKLWYSQAGTPRVYVTWFYKKNKQKLQLRLKQTCLPTPGQLSKKKPMHIPIKMGLISKKGTALRFSTTMDGDKMQETVLSLTEEEQTFNLYNVKEDNVPSLLRDFSAPIILTTDISHDDLLILLKYDTNAFCQWDAGQSLLKKHFLINMKDFKEDINVDLLTCYTDSLELLINSKQLSNRYICQLLTLPAPTELIELLAPVDPSRLGYLYQKTHKFIAQQYQALFLKLYTSSVDKKPYAYDPKRAGKRQLKNIALYYLAQADYDKYRDLIQQQYCQSDNISDCYGALVACNYIDDDLRKLLLSDFYKKWSKEQLVVNKWLKLQARANIPHVFHEIKALCKHEAFDITNPNKVYALLGNFVWDNISGFHLKDGSAYNFLIEYIINLDKINPQIAARMTQPLTQWKKLALPWQEQLKHNLNELATHKLSKDVSELINKSLK